MTVATGIEIATGTVLRNLPVLVALMDVALRKGAKVAEEMATLVGTGSAKDRVLLITGPSAPGAARRAAQARPTQQSLNADAESKGTGMIEALLRYLSTAAPGPVPATAELDRLLAACWHEFSGDDGGMKGEKLLGRMEEVAWEPPSLSFTIERHGGTVLGSSRAQLQRWTLNLEKKLARSGEVGFRQVRAKQPRLDVAVLVEEIANLILKRQEDERLKWYDDRRVRVFTSKVLLVRSAARQTVAGRRKRFRAALRERLVRDGWQEVRGNVYAHGDSEE